MGDLVLIGSRVIKQRIESEENPLDKAIVAIKSGVSAAHAKDFSIAYEVFTSARSMFQDLDPEDLFISNATSVREERRRYRKIIDALKHVETSIDMALQEPNFEQLAVRAATTLEQLIAPYVDRPPSEQKAGEPNMKLLVRTDGPKEGLMPVS